MVVPYNLLFQQETASVKDVVKDAPSEINIPTQLAFYSHKALRYSVDQHRPSITCNTRNSLKRERKSRLGWNLTKASSRPALSFSAPAY